MLVFKYSKVHPSSLAGHMDTVRTFMRMLRRAQCTVAYSVGFNPHMLVFASPALPVGIDSVCEYMAVDMNLEQDIVAKLNAVSPNGISILQCWQVDGVNLSNIITSAQYNIAMSGIAQYAPAISAQSYSITFMAKGVPTTKEVSAQIHSVEGIDDDNIAVVLDCGNSTLRADRIVANIINENNITCDYLITKTAMFVADIDMDSYLDNINTAKQ